MIKFKSEGHLAKFSAVSAANEWIADLMGMHAWDHTDPMDCSTVFLKDEHGEIIETDKWAAAIFASEREEYFEMGNDL